jgi:hypothetical protein
MGEETFKRMKQFRQHFIFNIGSHVKMQEIITFGNLQSKKALPCAKPHIIRITATES